MKAESFIKKQLSIVLVSVIALTSTAIAFSYALFSRIDANTSSQTITTGNLSISLSSTGSNITGSLTPMTDEEGLAATGYSFTTTNNGSLPSILKVTLKNGSATDNIPHQYIKFSVDGQMPVLLSNMPKENPDETNENSISYLLYDIVVPISGTNSHTIRVWLEEDTPAIYVGKYINLWLNYDAKVYSETLANKIISDNTILYRDSNYNITPGLYNDSVRASGNNMYYFRGDVTNNYVSFATRIWRITSITNDGVIRLITDDTIDDMYLNGSRTATIAYSGTSSSISDANYNTSKVKTALDDWYQRVLINYDSYIATSTYKNDVSLTASNRINSDSPSFSLGTDISLKIGILSIDELYFTSLSNHIYYLPNTFLSKSNSWYTMSAANTTDGITKMYAADETQNKAVAQSTTAELYIRPVININANTLYISGNGASDNPYKIGN